MPILFYNRFRGILDTWDPAFLDVLAANYTIILFDYPDIGNSNGELSSDILVDSQSVRWDNNRSLNGFDGNKKVNGVKPHVLVDKNGFLIAVMVSIASVHDGKAVLLLMRVLKEMLCGVKVILADGGYRGEIIAEVKKTFGYIIQVVLRSDKLEKDFQPVHKRWIIERTAPAARICMV